MKFFKCITLITLTAFSTFAVFAQKQIEMGDIFYNDFQYKEAIKEYEEIKDYDFSYIDDFFALHGRHRNHKLDC
jgi:lipopolysaccharide biosynthesis regulator YciM